jgi:hypothetical protein
LLASPVVGWPGLILGLIAGGALAPRAWKFWRIAAALGGAVIGNLAWAFATVYFR